MEYSEIVEELLTMASSPEIRLSYEQCEALRRIAGCRTMEMGGHIAYCPTCNTYTIVYNPCNHRGCPTCYEKNQIQWKNKLQEKLLPIGHYHLIFTIPDELKYVWLGERRNIEDTFFHCVQQAFKKLKKETGLLFGIIMVFQTHGRGLSYKPHMHCIVTSGGLNEKKEWVAFNSISYNLLRDTVKELFRPHILKKVRAENRNAVDTFFRISDERGWKVHPVYHQKSGNEIAAYLSRSIAGVVIDMHQDFNIDKEKGTIRFKEMHEGKEIWTTLKQDIFIERYLNHIPPKGSVMIRNYGLYSNRHKEELEKVRKERQERNKKETDQEEKEEGKELCPVCKTELIIKEIFLPGEYPQLLRGTLLNSLRDPPKHGELLRIA
jgi:hypothetical protein